MHIIVRMFKRNYRKCKRAVAIKLGKSKPDSSEGVTICRVSDKPVIWLLGTEDFGNLGDQKIAIAIRNFLDVYFKDYDVIEVSARNYFEHYEEIAANIHPEDIILGTGGGNFGNQYPTSQKIRQDFVARFKNNKIIIMPQTIWYTSDEEGRKSLQEDNELFAQHNRLMIVAREKKSLEFARKHFRNELYLAPDMVLSEKAFVGESERFSADKVVLCLRSDLEGVLDLSKQKQIVDILKKSFGVLHKTDTQKDYLISTKTREAEMQEILEEMSTASLVVTDRLHGMVFAAISQTPCIVFDNYNGKVKGIYEWMKELPYIRYKGTDTDIEQDIMELASMKGKCKFAIPEMEAQFRNLAEVIREL